MPGSITAILGEMLHLVLIGETRAEVFVDVLHDFGQWDDLILWRSACTKILYRLKLPVFIQEFDGTCRRMLDPVTFHVDLVGDIQWKASPDRGKQRTENPQKLVGSFQFCILETDDIRQKRIEPDECRYGLPELLLLLFIAFVELIDDRVEYGAELFLRTFTGEK